MEKLESPKSVPVESRAFELKQFNTVNTINFTVSPFDSPKSGETEMRSGCNDQKCPFLTEWSSWSPCGVTCGGGEQTRNRKCMYGLTSNIGCQEGLDQVQACNTKACPIFWVEWSSWSECSVYCGDGIRYSGFFIEKKSIITFYVKRVLENERGFV